MQKPSVELSSILIIRGGSCLVISKQQKKRKKEKIRSLVKIDFNYLNGGCTCYIMVSKTQLGHFGLPYCYYYLRVQNFAILGFRRFCGYLILRFRATKGKSSTLKSIGFVNVAVPRLKLLQCKNIVVFMQQHSTWCFVHPLSGRSKNKV